MTDKNASNYLKVKELYGVICNHELGDDFSGVQRRVDIIRELESITRKEFRNTSEFHEIVQAYINKKGERIKSLGKRIKRARKKNKMTLKQLAFHLGFKSHSAFIMYEKDKRLPPNEVIQWLLKVENPQNAQFGENDSTLGNTSKS